MCMQCFRTGVTRRRALAAGAVARGAPAWRPSAAQWVRRAHGISQRALLPSVLGSAAAIWRAGGRGSSHGSPVDGLLWSKAFPSHPSRPFAHALPPAPAMASQSLPTPAEETAWCLVGDSSTVYWAEHGHSDAKAGDWAGLWAHRCPDFREWTELGATVLAASGAKLEDHVHQDRFLPGFVSQLASAPVGSRVIFVGGWNDRLPWNPGDRTAWIAGIRGSLEALRDVADSRKLRPVRVLLAEPENADASELLEELYGSILPWPVYRDFPRLYRQLRPRAYWYVAGWDKVAKKHLWAWNRCDRNHRVWTPDARKELVSSCLQLLDGEL